MTERLELEPATVLNARQAFLGQEPITEASFLDAGDLLDLQLTTADMYDHVKVSAALEERQARLTDPRHNTEWHVAATMAVKMWVFQLQKGE